MRTHEAILIVAQQIAANAVRDLDWEDHPDIGENDWLWITDELETMVPEPKRFNEAITLLEQRAVDAALGIGDK